MNINAINIDDIYLQYRILVVCFYDFLPSAITKRGYISQLNLPHDILTSESKNWERTRPCFLGYQMKQLISVCKL